MGSGHSLRMRKVLNYPYYNEVCIYLTLPTVPTTGRKEAFTMVELALRFTPNWG